MQDHARIIDQAIANRSRETAEIDALLDRMLARRRQLAATVPGVISFADVSSDPDYSELRALRAARPSS